MMSHSLTLNCPLRAFEATKAEAGIHPSFDRTVIVFHYTVLHKEPNDSDDHR
jgi:hypothetical protein